MSQSKQWAADLGLTTRRTLSSNAKVGSGGNDRLYVGYTSAYEYKSYLRFDLNWANVGRIVSATLSLYTDDGLGDIPSSLTATPTAVVRRVTATWDEGTDNDEFVTADYAAPAATTSGQKAVSLSRVELALNQFDLTPFVELWAPSSVKRRDGTPGGQEANYGIVLQSEGDVQPTKRFAGASDDWPDANLRPLITLVYEYGLTAPSVPTNLVPSGAVVALDAFEGDFDDIDANDKLKYSEVEVYTSAATNTGQVVTGGTRIYHVKQQESNTAALLAHFSHTPASLALVRGTTYKWRVRVYDQDGSASLYTDLTSFSFSNTDPDPPVTTPVESANRATLDGQLFRGGFSDDDASDYLLAYEVQMSAYPEGDAHWLDDEFILWSTGKRYVTRGTTTWETPYGGGPLTVGTYYWRARVWDNHHGHSAYTYHSIDVTSDFEAEPGQTTIQNRPRAPWRIVIKDMYQSDGVTKTVGRGPGRTVAVLEDAKNVGASLLFNSPGELHFTLGKDHPQISVIEPKQTHYSVQFRQGDAWREIFAGLMWDFDASDTDVILYGIDYLGLLQYVLDERYDPSNPDKAAESGGSKYVTSGKNAISYIVTDQLTRAKNLANSPVGFISIGSIASMDETLTVFSTYAVTLDFVTSLLDSHRAGTGKKTRLSVKQTAAGGYEFVVEDDPGNLRDNLRLKYGELVQGYRVIPFGTDWASRLSAIGRAKDGLRVMYKTKTAPGIDEAVWGRFTRATFIDGVSDENDLTRRTAAGALRGGKLGKNIALGLRSGILQPRDGWDLMDQFPVDIEDGSVSTSAFGSGYWVAVGITWTADSKTGKQETSLTLQPREDLTSPDADLLTLAPISPQAEWQIGWSSPNPLTATSLYWLDQTTGIVYIRAGGAIIKTGITGA